MTHDNGGDCESSRNTIEPIYDHIVKKDTLQKEVRKTSTKTHQFRTTLDDIDKDLDKEFVERSKATLEPVTKLVLSVNHERKARLTVLEQKDGTFCVKFLPVTEAMQIFKGGYLKFTVIDFKSDSKHDTKVYFKKCIKYGINVRDAKKFTLEQHKQLTMMAYEVYVDWLKPIIEAGGYGMIVCHGKKSVKPKNLKNKKSKNDGKKKKKVEEKKEKNDEAKIMKEELEKPKYIVKSRL